MKSLQVGVQIRTSGWQTHRFYVGLFQDSPKGDAEVGITVDKYIASVFQKACEWIGKIPGDLHHERVAK